MQKICISCKSEFETNIRNKWGNYCSVFCALPFMQPAKKRKIERLLGQPYPKCINPDCNKPVTIMIDKNKLSLFCSRKCGGFHNSKISREKSKQTMKARYGVEHAIQADIFKEKAKETSLKKYGSENISKTNYFKNKFKETCREKYGVDNVFQLKSVQKKSKETNIKNYGVAHPQVLPEIKEKIIKTNIERHGVEYTSQSPIVRKKNNTDKFRKI